MIAIIADDLTGAAELGGIGLRYHFNVEFNTEVNMQSRADLLVIDMDSRSQSQQLAEKAVEKVCSKLDVLKPRFVYKKIDSVLRGHVLKEISVQMKMSGKRRALIVPANPELNRTIVNGTYYFKGLPVHLSSFARDPEFPVTSSLIADMLRAGIEEVHVLKHYEPMPQTGFIIGEVQTKSDLEAWAKRLDDDTLAAGGSGFFEAILNKFCYPTISQSAPKPQLQQPTLYVCGTTFQKTRDRIKREKEKGGPVSYLPADLLKENQPTGQALQRWTREIRSLLLNHQQAIVAIDPETAAGVSALDLREYMATAVAQVLKQTQVGELLLEGGSTAAAVLRKAGITKFVPVQQLAPGVIRMSTKDTQNQLFLTLKPGSYDWPANILVFDEG